VLIVGLGLSFLACNLKHVADLSILSLEPGMATPAVASNDGKEDDSVDLGGIDEGGTGPSSPT
jgi:hypothetical protein